MEFQPGKLFVGGISQHTTEVNLQKHFKKFGEITECVILRDKYTGMGRGFGFVTFLNPSVVEKVLDEEHEIFGRKVDLKPAQPKADKNKNQQQQKNKPSTNNFVGNDISQLRNSKIFVGGLPPALTLQEFADHFKKFGTITDKVMMHNKETNKPRGFGFITFDNEESAEKALENRYHELKNKKVEVKWAEPSEDYNKNTWTYVCNDLACESFAFPKYYEPQYPAYFPYGYSNFAPPSSMSAPFYPPSYGYYRYPMPYMNAEYYSQRFYYGSCSDIGSYSEPTQGGFGFQCDYSTPNGINNNDNDVMQQICVHKERTTKVTIRAAPKVSDALCKQKIGTPCGLLPCTCLGSSLVATDNGDIPNGTNGNNKDAKEPNQECVAKDTMENGNMNESNGVGDDGSSKLEILAPIDNVACSQNGKIYENEYVVELGDSV